MNAKIEAQNDTLTVFLSGEIDHHSAREIREEVDLQITSAKPQVLVLDFKDVSFMDSSGIGLIMGRYKLISKRGGQAVMVNLKPTVRKIFQMSGIFKILSEDKDVESVLQKIKAEV